MKSQCGLNKNTNSTLVKFNQKSKSFELNWKAVRWWSLISLRLQIESLKETVDFAQGRLLDVGCGSKPYLPLFAAKVEKYFGVDYGKGEANDYCHDAAADGRYLPFKSDTFDTVLCTEVIEHLEEPWQAIEEMSRVLKPGGHLILSAPQTYWLHEEPRDFYRFTPYGLRYLMEKNGFILQYFKAKGDAGHFLLDLFTKSIWGVTGLVNILLRKIAPRLNRDINDLLLLRRLFFFWVNTLFHGYRILQALTQKTQKAVLHDPMRYEVISRGEPNIPLNGKFTLGHVVVGIKST